MMLRCRSKRTDFLPHSTGIETRPGAQAIDCAQNQTTGFSSRLRRPLQCNPSPVGGGSSPRSIYQQAGFAVTLVFLLIFSGPPKFRLRDPEASLRDEIDWVVILHVIVWGLAGLWVLLQIGKRLNAKRPLLRLRLPQIRQLHSELAVPIIRTSGVRNFSFTISDSPWIYRRHGMPRTFTVIIGRGPIFQEMHHRER